ncbi:MAG: hypothetical protein K5864_04930 [Bacteroidales bacterium]|nr:hypothetical protein [Bacteroidales bacterium]
MKTLCLSATVLKFLLGAVFVVSAVAKFVTIDAFEVYVYSFGFFNLGLSFIVARLVIASELVLGAALLSGRRHRFTMLMSVLYLLCFVVFLVYAQLIGRTDSCHCFGELLPFNPTQSLLKNAVLIFLLLVAWKWTYAQWAPRWWQALIIGLVVSAISLLFIILSLKELFMYSLVLLLVMTIVLVLAALPFYRKWFVTATLVAAPVVALFVLSPPDSWLFRGENQMYDEATFYQSIGVSDDADAVSDSTLAGAEVLRDLHLDEGRHVVAFFTPGCPFCQLAATKLTTLYHRHGTSLDQIVYLFPAIKDLEAVDAFYEATLSDEFPQRIIDKHLFIKITRGTRPLVLLVDNGAVKASYSYRDIDEDVVSSFLTGEEL